MAIALLQSGLAAAADNNAATTAAVDTTGADCIVVGTVARYGGGVLTDSKANTWLPLTEYVNSDSRVLVRLYYCLAPVVGAAHTFTFTKANAGPVLGFVALSGVAGYESENGYGADTAGTSIQPGSVTPAASGSLVVTCAGCHGETVSISIDSGCTELDALYVASQHYAGGFGWLIQAVAAAVNPTWSWTRSNRRAAAIAVFAPAATGNRRRRLLIAGAAA